MRATTRTVVLLGAGVLVAVTAFLGWQEGVPAYQRSQPPPPVTAGERLALPEQVFDPGVYVPATDDWGAPGPVSLVFQGVRARDGFSGEVAAPWYAVSARTGGYWRLDLPHLTSATRRMFVSPQGTQIVWWSAQGVARYDTMTGDTRTYPATLQRSVEPSSTLVWSPDATRLAYGRDPVHVLDLRTAEVTELPLRLPPGGEAPAWTADGRWVSVTAADAVAAVQVRSGRRRVLSVPVGRLGDADWSAAGVLAGVHPQRFGNVLRLVRGGGDLGAGGGGAARAAVVDKRPRLVVSGSWGWADSDELVLTGVRPETGALEQAMSVSVPSADVQPFTQFPTQGANWVDVATVSVAADMLAAGPEAFEQPTTAWSPVAKLLLCLLVAVFPVLYYLIARRPPRRQQPRPRRPRHGTDRTAPARRESAVSR